MQPSPQQPQPSYQLQPPYQAPYPHPQAARRPQLGYGKIIAAAVVVVVVVVVLTVAVPYLQRAATQPNISLTETNASCSWFDVMTFYFTLVNSGDADGFATLGFYADSSQVKTNRYFVAAKTAAEKTESATVNDCGSVSTYDIRILSVEKG